MANQNVRAAVVVVSSLALLGYLAVDARAVASDATEPNRRLAPMSTLPVDPSFGTRPGDCPQEDSCRADYDGELNRWVIRPVIP